MSIHAPRIYIFDNVKALLIMLVVLGHAADYYTADSKAMRIFFFYIYLFHMPLFIFLAGLFSKSTIMKNPFRLEKVAYFITLYILLEFLFYLMLNVWMGRDNHEFNLFETDGVPWFMLAMAAWLCIGRLIRTIPARITLPASILLAVLVGYTNIGDILVLSRIIVFLPFFLLGYYMKPQALVDILHSKLLKFASVLLLLLAGYYIATSIDTLYDARNLLSGRNPYDKVAIDLGIPFDGAILRLIIMGATISLSIAVLAVMTHKRTWFTVLGERSIAIYFFHRFVLFIYHHYHLNDLLEDYFPKAWLPIYLFLFAIVAVLLAWKPFEQLLLAIQRPVDKIFKRKDTSIAEVR